MGKLGVFARGLACGAVSMAVMSAAALAQERSPAEYGVDRHEHSNWAIGVAISTIGVGPEVTVRLHPNAIFRISTGFADATPLTSGLSVVTGNTFSGGSQFSETKYSISALDVMGARAVIDLHPFRDGGRISLGAGYLDVSGKAAPDFATGSTATIKIGDTNYTQAQAKGVGFTFENTNKFMGYTGFGFDNAFYKEYGLSFSSDFGVLWGYSHEVALTGAQSISAADRAKETATLKSKLNELTVYPVVQFSAKYRF